MIDGMSEQPKVRPCRVCGNTCPETSFELTNYRRRGRVCAECRAVRKADAVLPKWDWARAMSKFAIMRSRKQESRRGLVKRPNSSGFKEYSSVLTHEVLRALLECQNGRCAITGQAMYLPIDTELKPNQTLTSWIKKLPKSQANMTPVLVRLEPTLPWEVGNIAFIVKAWREIYESCSSYSSFIQLLLNMRNVTTQAPTRDALFHALWRRAKQRMEAVK